MVGGCGWHRYNDGYYLMGHSMGTSLIGWMLRFTDRRLIKGVVLIDPVTMFMCVFTDSGLLSLSVVASGAASCLLGRQYVYVRIVLFARQAAS